MAPTSTRATSITARRPRRGCSIATAAQGRYDLASYLVERGASTDIFLAAALGLTDRVRTMIDADPSLLDLRIGRGHYGEQPPSAQHIYLWTIGDSRSPLDVAAQFDQQETLELLLGFASPMQRFMLACRHGDEPAARAVLRDDPTLMARLARGRSSRDHRRGLERPSRAPSR